MSSGQIVSGRLEDETLERFQRYTEDKDLSKSESLRRLVARGIEAEPPTRSERKEAAVEYLDRVATNLGSILAAASVLALALSFTTPYLDLLSVGAIAMATIGVNGGLLALRMKGLLR